MRIGQKITLGFAVILALAATIGAIAAVSMVDVGGKANSLANRNVPAVSAATQVERASLQTMYEIRGWTMSGDEAMYRRGIEHLDQVDKAITTAADLARAQNLPGLGDAAVKAKTKAADYRALLEQTVKANQAEDLALKARAAAGAEFMKHIGAFVGGQTHHLKEEILAVTAADKLEERRHKVALANDIIDLGNAIRIAAFRSAAERNPAVAEAALPNFTTINEKLTELTAITRQEANLLQLKATRQAADLYKQEMHEVLELTKQMAVLASQRGTAAQAVLEAAQEAAKVNTEKAQEAAEDASVSLARATTILISGLIAMAIIGIAFAYGITRGIVSALTRMAADLGSCSQQTASAAGQVANAGQALAAGTTENAASLEETSASMEEMSSLVRTTSQNTDSAASVAQEAKTAGDRGAQAMTDLAAAIADIKANADQTAKIIKTIDEIAFQTNLLALNAAVEAARAGDAGKGFAVVAEEVRNLAQRAGQAARTTSELIEKSVQSAERGVGLSKNVTDVVSDMSGATVKVSSLVGEIAASTKEIATGIDQVVKAVRTLDQTTQSNAASAEENSAVGEELSAQAASLADLVRGLEAMIIANPTATPAAPTHRAPAPSRKTLPAERLSAGQRHPAISHHGDQSTLDRF